MADVQHAALTGASLHEPKGADSASVDQVFVADGAGSGTFEKLTTDSLATNIHYFTVQLEDVSTAKSVWVHPGVAGEITKISTVLHDTITAANAGLTFKIAGTAMTSSAITITQSGSAAGDVDTSSPTALNTITAVQPIEIITDGASSTDRDVTLTFQINLT